MYDKYYKLADNLTYDEFCVLMCTQLKEEDKLTWQQVADIINTLYDVNYTRSCYKSKRDRLKNKLNFDLESFNSNESEVLNDDLTSDLEKLKIEKFKLSDERSQINNSLRRISREETLKEIAQEVADRMNKDKLLNPICRTVSTSTDKEGLLLLSDWHYGILIENNFNRFNPDIARLRVAKLLDEVISIIQKDKLSKITVANLGDMVAGNIHLKIRLQSRIDLLTQIMEVSELLAEFLFELCKFTDVDYISVYDNHSRIDPNKKDSLELESLCRITDWYLKSRLGSNILFLSENPSDIANIKIKGHEIAFEHGHKDALPNIIKNINNFLNKHVDLICSAHLHHFSADESCNTVLISNGSLMGTDSYAYDLRLCSPPSQTLIEITDDNVLDDIKKINLN